MDKTLVDGRMRYTLNGHNIYVSMAVALACHEKMITSDDKFFKLSKIISSQPFQYIGSRQFFGSVKLDKMALDLTLNEMYQEGLDWISTKGAEDAYKHAEQWKFHPEDMFFIVNNKNFVVDLIDCFAMRNANLGEGGKLKPLSSALGTPEIYLGDGKGLINFLREPATLIKITMPITYTAHPCYKSD
jgi:hypothetical protein